MKTWCVKFHLTYLFPFSGGPCLLRKTCVSGQSGLEKDKCSISIVMPTCHTQKKWQLVYMYYSNRQNASVFIRVKYSVETSAISMLVLENFLFHCSKGLPRWQCYEYISSRCKCSNCTICSVSKNCLERVLPDAFSSCYNHTINWCLLQLTWLNSWL